MPPFFKVLQSQEKSAQEAALQTLYQSFNGFAARFIGDGPFFAGKDLTLADIALMPWMGRLHILEKHRAFSLSKTDPKFEAWAKHVTQLDSFKRTTSDLKHYDQIYGRYLRDEAQSEAAKATRSGSIIP